MKRFIKLFIFVSIFTNYARAQHIDSIVAQLTTDKERADTLYKLERKQFKKARFDSAGYFLNKGMVFAQRSKDDELIAKFFIEQSFLFFFRDMFKEGLDMLKKLYPYLVKSKAADLHNSYLLFNGRFYEKLHRNDSALYYYHQCELFNSNRKPYNNWLVYYNIAQLFKRAEAFSDSENYFTKAYNLTKPAGNPMDHITVLVEFADLYYLLEKPIKFATLMYEQQKMMERVKKDFTKNPAHTMFLNARKKEPLEKKIKFMEAVKQELKNGGHIVKAAEANNYIAGFCEEINQPARALPYLQENIDLFEKQNDLINLYYNVKSQYRLMKNAGFKEEAIAVADRIFTLKDSIIALQQREMVMELEARYQTDKKEKEILFLHSKNELHEKEIALLNTENRLSAFKLLSATNLKNSLQTENKLKDSIVKSELAINKLISNENKLKSLQLANEQLLKASVNRENILKEKELATERSLRWKLSFASGLLLLSGIVIFFMYRKQRFKTMLIQKQSDNLQILMKEIHHRVKNNLQVISSLLDLQSLSIKDKQASGAVREGKLRVQSMALIHQNLYSEGNIKGIVMEDYIKTLVENLFHSYNIRQNKIKLMTDIDHLNLDVDTVIPLGLIINELISNSLKYAFGATEQGEIHVSLKEKNKQLELQVKDNGCGFPPGWNKMQTTSFGYNLVKAFAQKLKAKLDMYNDKGACVLMNISKYKMA